MGLPDGISFSQTEIAIRCIHQRDKAVTEVYSQWFITLKMRHNRLY